MLYQATLPLFPKGGKFVVVGSRAGVLSIPKVVPAGAYGQSKAAVHFLVSPISAMTDNERAEKRSDDYIMKMRI